ncbi:DUF4350 domain-containing protein [Actinoplanes sp. NPDC051851]|uniref:DUF4350 domain-containing protein n=1 Tax=Actinoplanes sp. NPDC051851 TaxID=3154753 RepID=UPI0034146222
MTVTDTRPNPVPGNPAPVPAAAARTPRGRRWLRVAIPVVALFTLVTGTLIVHATQQPDPEGTGYLSPSSTAGTGSGTLAERLAARGVTVDRETSTAVALDVLWSGGEVPTLFVTTPSLADLDRISHYGAVPAGTHVVVVAPTAADLDEASGTWPVEISGGNRWTAAAPAPGCDDPIALAAGPAAVERIHYQSANATSCYRGGLVTFVFNGATVTVVGAADPFRNDRIGEHGNAALAVGLLSRTRRVVWLDVHDRETPPAYVPPSGDGDATTDPYATETATPQATGTDGTGSTGGTPGDGGTGTGTGPEAEENPLADAFPPAVWATLALFLLFLLALAVAAARRLGAPVPEPLPSRVAGNETMLGHARLYQRARARTESLDILRAAARRRLAEHLNLPPGAGIAAIAEHAGLVEADVQTILGGGFPENDDELVAAATAVQDLVREIIEGDRS